MTDRIEDLLNPERKNHQRVTPRTARFFTAFVALVLLTFFVQQGYASYTRYWVIADGIQGMASITDEGSHTAYYKYTVAGVAYTGRSSRDWRDPRYLDIGVGV